MEHQKRAADIVEAVLAVFDYNKDGKISLAEFERGGLDALPNFDDAEGHHYDVESGAYITISANSLSNKHHTEFFLHHEGSPAPFVLGFCSS